MEYKFNKGFWCNTQYVAGVSCICWNCNNKIASEKVFYSQDSWGNRTNSRIFICPNCHAPIITDDDGKEILLPLPGKEIKKLPEDINKIYFEIRKSLQSNCFNGAIMLMRKLIMHIAVEEEAEEGKSFIEYINFLYDNGIIPKKSKNKAHSVRNFGNDANHKIETRTKEEAFNCFGLIELLLSVNYEFADENEENA